MEGVAVQELGSSDSLFGVVGPQDYHYLFTILHTIYTQQTGQWII
jgi:hypothetical protein